MIAVEPVVDDRAHVEALARIAKLMGARYGTLDGDEFEILSILVAAYKERALPMKCPDLRSAVMFQMDQRKLAVADLEALIGSKAASSIVEGDPKLSLTLARLLHRDLGVPAETLLA